MRNAKFLGSIMLILSITILRAQESSINDFSFESVSNPSFVLLDETPSSFSMPSNLKALALYLSNGFSNTNIAVEVNPYWILGWHKEDKSYEQYRGLSAQGDQVRIDPFQRFKTNSSISFAFVEKELIGLEGPRKTVTAGGRFTFLELYSKNRIKTLNNIFDEIGGSFSNEVLDGFDGYITGPIIDLTSPDPSICSQTSDSGTYPREYVNAAVTYFEANKIEVQTIYIDASELLKAYFEESCALSSDFVFNAQNIQPVFRLDGALGYSILFLENNISSPTVNRFGSWLTADVGLRLTDTQYLHLLGIARYIDDGFQIDRLGEFTNTSFFDYGAKIEFQIDRFKLAYEYLERTGDGEMYRSVGNIYYQLNKNLGITGGFGKDFQSENNLISILGISWGIDSGENLFGN